MARFEFSSKMQTIEIYTPNRDAKGKVTGLNHEAVFYDPEALVDPIRIVRNYARLSGFEEGEPYTYIECMPTIFPVKGTRRPSSPGMSSSTKCPTCTAAHGRRSGRSTSSRAWRSPKDEDIFTFEN